MTKPQLTAWRIQIVETLAGVYEFHVHRFTEHHYRLTIHNNCLDYWPNTERAMWVKGKQSFKVEDIEKFIDKRHRDEGVR